MSLYIREILFPIILLVDYHLSTHTHTHTHTHIHTYIHTHTNSSFSPTINIDFRRRAFTYLHLSLSLALFLFSHSTSDSFFIWTQFFSSRNIHIPHVLGQNDHCNLWFASPVSVASFWSFFCLNDYISFTLSISIIKWKCICMKTYLLSIFPLFTFLSQCPEGYFSYLREWFDYPALNMQIKKQGS